MGRMLFDVHAGDNVNFVPQHFNGDHNELCQSPLTTRPLTEDHTVGTHVWWCAPGDDPTKGHFMTGIDTTGYVIISFTPKAADGGPVFFPQSANKICWDQNVTDLGGRKWTQLIVVSDDSFHAQGSNLAYLNPGNNDNFAPADPQARPLADDFSIKFLRGTAETFVGQTKTGDNFFIAANGITDKATRYRTCVRDNGEGTVTYTQARPGGTVSATLPGGFPAGPRAFLLGDDSYNVLKSYTEGAVQVVADPFSWHFDNLEVSADG